MFDLDPEGYFGMWVGRSGRSGSLGRYVGQVGRSGMVWYFPIEFD